MNYDAIIIGSGQAGVPLATRLAGVGQRVLLVERAALGGTCINYGCTPTKTMVASARAAHVVRRAHRLGIRGAEAQVDLAAVVQRKNEIVEQWRAGTKRRIEAAGENLTLLRGHARFSGERQIAVDGERHQATTVIINAGARPMVPQLPGLENAPFLDNRSIMELRTVPRHLLVLGGGYVGCEFAQMFRRFGAKVTVIERGGHLLIHEDEDVSSALEQVFRDEGIALEQNVEVEAVRSSGEGLSLRLGDGREVAGSHLLVATGRRPNTEDLGCEKAGIELSSRGFVEVDDGYQTSAIGVYAVGDAAGSPQFTHTSWDEHRHLFDRLMGRSYQPRSDRLVPYVVFTDPQVAAVGLKEHEARSRGVEHEVATVPFGNIARAIETDETAGLLKVLIDPRDEKLLGAAIVGAEAGELLHVFVTLMQVKASARAIVDAQIVHPTYSEGLQSVLMRLSRFAL